MREGFQPDGAGRVVWDELQGTDGNESFFGVQRTDEMSYGIKVKGCEWSQSLSWFDVPLWYSTPRCFAGQVLATGFHFFGIAPCCSFTRACFIFTMPLRA